MQARADVIDAPSAERHRLCSTICCSRQAGERLAIAALASFALASCREEAGLASAKPGIERFGISESQVHRPLVLSAIQSANAILRIGDRHFAPGLATSQPATAIQVYAVRGPLGSREIMTTHTECRCVVVQAGALDAWLAEKAGSGSALLAVEPRLILSYMLLHEAGHIGDDASILGAESGQSPRILSTAIRPRRKNAKPLPMPSQPMPCDRTAGGRDQGLAAAEVAMALSQLSWNLAAHRLIDDFGGTALGKSSTRSRFYADLRDGPYLPR